MRSTVIAMAENEKHCLPITGYENHVIAIQGMTIVLGSDQGSLEQQWKRAMYVEISKQQQAQNKLDVAISGSSVDVLIHTGNDAC